MNALLAPGQADSVDIDPAAGLPRVVAVAVGFERVVLASRWADHAWRLVAMAPAGEPIVGASLVCDNLELSLHADEAENYLLNLSAPAPMLFVVWREETGTPSVLMVTVSYGEAARMLDAGENVEGVSLPPDLLGWVEDFSRHYFRPPEKKAKNKRYASSRQGARS
jgi:hypothetical protein